MEKKEWDQKWGSLWGKDKKKYVLLKGNSGQQLFYSVYDEYKCFVILETFEEGEIDYIIFKMIENGVKIVNSLDEIKFKNYEYYKSTSDWIKDSELVRKMLLEGYQESDILKAMILPKEDVIEDQIEYLIKQDKYPTIPSIAKQKK